MDEKKDADSDFSMEVALLVAPNPSDAPDLATVRSYLRAVIETRFKQAHKLVQENAGYYINEINREQRNLATRDRERFDLRRSDKLDDLIDDQERRNDVRRVILYATTHDADGQVDHALHHKLVNNPPDDASKEWLRKLEPSDDDPKYK